MTDWETQQIGREENKLNFWSRKKKNKNRRLTCYLPCPLRPSVPGLSSHPIEPEKEKNKQKKRKKKDELDHVRIVVNKNLEEINVIQITINTITKKHRQKNHNFFVIHEFLTLSKSLLPSYPADRLKNALGLTGSSSKASSQYRIF